MSFLILLLLFSSSSLYCIILKDWMILWISLNPEILCLMLCCVVAVHIILCSSSSSCWKVSVCVCICYVAVLLCQHHMLAVQTPSIANWRLQHKRIGRALHRAPQWTFLYVFPNVLRSASLVFGLRSYLVSVLPSSLSNRPYVCMCRAGQAMSFCVRNIKNKKIIIITKIWAKILQENV